MLHITDIQKFLQCPYLYLYSLNHEKKEYVSYLRTQESFVSLLEKKLKITDAFYGSVGDGNEKALAAMETKEWLIHARFEYLGLRVNLLAMHRNEDYWDIYFGRTELYPHEDQAQYMADNLWVLRKLGIPIGNLYSVHFNQEYEREGELDYDKLLKVSDIFYNSRNHPSHNIKLVVDQKDRNLEPIIHSMENLDVTHLQGRVKTSRCHRRIRCNYYDECWPLEKEVEDNSILHLSNSEHKQEMYAEGIRYLKDADINRIEGSQLQYAQIMADKNGGLFCDKLGLKQYMEENIRFPLSFIDFEWDSYSVPPYHGMHPFDVSLFQYSLHILDSEDGELRHEEYIGVRDCRKELLEDMLHKLPKEGSIVTFNGFGAEIIRMRELAELFPEYAEEIEDINRRMVDFSQPFSTGLIYDLKMRGAYSLKQIVEIFGEKMSYRNLDIGKAMNAVQEWRVLEEGVDELEEIEIRKKLSEYCSMDTYSLYLVYNWFKEILAGEPYAQYTES